MTNRFSPHLKNFAIFHLIVRLFIIILYTFKLRKKIRCLGYSIWDSGEHRTFSGYLRRLNGKLPLYSYVLDGCNHQLARSVPFTIARNYRLTMRQRWGIESKCSSVYIVIQNKKKEQTYCRLITVMGLSFLRNYFLYRNNTTVLRIIKVMNNPFFLIDYIISW